MKNQLAQSAAVGWAGFLLPHPENFYTMVLMTNRQKFFFTLGLSILLVVAISIYIFKDLNKTSNQPLTQPENTSTTSQISIQTTGPDQNYKVSVVNVPADSPKMASNRPKIPNLDLPVVNYNRLDGAAFKIVANNIVNLANELKKDPKDELKWLNLGIYRKMVGDYEVSVEILKYVGILWPNDYVPFNNLADLYQYYIKNYPLAEKNWLKVIELKPDYTDPYENLYHLYKDPNYKDKEPESLPILLKGLDNNPKSIDLMVYLARHYRAAGDKDKATIYYNKAMEEAHLEKNTQIEDSLRSEATGNEQIIF